MKSIKAIVTIVLVLSFMLGVGGGVVGTLFVNRITINNTIEKQNVDGTTLQVGGDSDTIEAVRTVSPSVVSISIFQDISSISNRTGPNLFRFDDFFEFPFEFELSTPEDQDGGIPDIRRQQVGGGSGFIISPNGLIITNKHVVDDETAVFFVVLQDGTEYEAQVLGLDPFNDIAVLKIEANNLSSVNLGNSDSIEIGQSVIAIGNSLGDYQNTVTKGIVSGINRRVIAGDRGSIEIIEEAIQTDAAINPGNSGGPLINLQGEVIGVNTAISRSGQLIGFAIPVNTVKHVVESVIEFGRIVRPWLGVRYVINSEKYAADNVLDRSDGAVLVAGVNGSLGVLPDSPADKAGLQTGDIILKIDNALVNQQNPLGKIIASYKPGDTVVVTLFREGKELSVTAQLEEFVN